MREDQIALQLYTVRRPAAEDLPGTLRAVAAAGYRNVELAGLPELPTEQIADLLREHGLRPVASHVPLDDLRTDATAVADRMATLDCPRVVVPWLPEGDRTSLEGARQLAAELAGYRETLAARGLRLGYHNHAFEFEPLDGSTLWDVLLTGLPPEFEFEIDVYWAAFAGRDPVAEIEATRGRVKLLHMKDMVREDPQPHDAPAGDGSLPFRDIISAGRAAGVEWYIVEQDEPSDPLVDVATSLRHLRSLAE
jgi:sugar phosphate isomerase/epimerase